MFKNVDPRVNFPEMERALLAHWYTDGIVEKYLHRNDASEKRFSFIDGPITANNPMGVHHAWGRTYKDLWQRFWNMRGYKERFQNGFDCQGLWVEVEVEKELGIKNKQDIENLVPGDTVASIAKFVEMCKERVRKYSGIQTDQTKRLGNFMNWDHSYFTMSDENNYMIWYFLKVVFEKGWMYKGNESVPWCPRCQTAISQHEMLTEDYKELVHDSIFIEFPIVGREKEYLLVWTTTPWTIPANIAVAVDKDLDYALVEGSTGDRYWIVKERVEPVFKSDVKVIKTVKGSELVGLTYTGPFDSLPVVADVAKNNLDTFHHVVPTDNLIMPISTTEGTGLVHTAVSAGTEDFKLGKKLGLPMIPIIADDASYLEGLDDFTGQNAKKHPEIIFDALKAKEEKGENWIFSIEPYKHRYPCCWRCKTELVWKVAEEWYIGMDIVEKDGTKTFREQMIDSAKMIDWNPSFALDRELDWLTNMHDWLISKKNRYWGLALPIYTCEKCGKFTVIGSKEELQEKAVEGWESFDGHSPHKPYIDMVKISCECGGVMTRTDDVGNPWLDAGIVPFSTLLNPETGKLSYTTDKKYWSQWYPADFITESFPGQFKNWFYALIAMSTALEKRNPFKKILGYASVVGEDGRPMHKSWGNSIEFNEAADAIGADVMRWMYATADVEQNLRFGAHRGDEVRRQFHLMLWNIYNFFVLNANGDNWTPTEAKVESQNVLDQWILARLNETIRIATEGLESASAQKASLSIDSFVNDLSLWYVRRSRDRIGPTVEDSDDKKACYQTLHFVLVTLMKLMAPFTPFLSDEIYTNLTGEESVHLANWPVAGEIDTALLEDMKIVRRVVEIGLSLRKEQQLKVRQPLAKFTVQHATSAITDEGLLQLMKDELNVKSVVFETGEGELSGVLDTTLTPELMAEGQARELIRQIQDERKKLGTSVSEKVQVTLPEWPEQYEAYIKKSANVEVLTKGDVVSVARLT